MLAECFHEGLLLVLRHDDEVSQYYVERSIDYEDDKFSPYFVNHRLYNMVQSIERWYNYC